MLDELFIGRGTKKYGPFSTEKLQEMAAAGKIQHNDTVWKEGMVDPVLASKVKNLFPASQGQATPPVKAALGANGTPSSPSSPAVLAKAETPVSQAEVPETKLDARQPVFDNLTDDAPLVPLTAYTDPEAAPEPEAAPSPKVEKPARPKPEPVRKRRAIAGAGAIILSQDGVHVHYRKKCVDCGHEDTSRSTMQIGNGVTRVNFFCRKCRKNKQVLIQGTIQ